MDPNSGRLIPVAEGLEVGDAPRKVQFDSLYGEVLAKAGKLMPEAEAKARGLVPVPPEELERVKAMSPEERQRWAAEMLTRAGKPNMNRKQRRLAVRNARLQARRDAKAKAKKSCR